MIKLTRHQKDMNQIDTIEKLGTKLKCDVKDRDQLRSFPFFLIDCILCPPTSHPLSSSLLLMLSWKTLSIYKFFL